MFTEKTRRAIYKVAEDCAPDMGIEELEESTNTKALILAEIALDASRLTTWGYPEADEEVHELIEAYGYDAVLKAAARFVPIL